ncbi:unnamed protein product [Eruca vesicaria subsp. sativa]|uniref:Uncharacterized protein n=1 Tax=Eruca vesicaria subsp. sativa TaxID=29727 RepID=A0ABC8J4R3_ERUVS|nr:unnamed protein product [Eruca vesicaria subsp. sativa]
MTLRLLLVKPKTLELGYGLLKKSGKRSKEEKHGIEEERDVNCVEAKENNNNNFPVVDVDGDDVADGSDSATVCGVLQEDGTTCTTSPVIGRKRWTEHKGQRISCLPPAKNLPCKVPTAREECGETKEICGVILPDMIRCKSKPVSRRKRCEDHNGMRVNAFFFLLNPTERDKILKEDKSKPVTRSSSMNQEEPSQSLLCEATTKNGLPCTRSAPKGSTKMELWTTNHLKMFRHSKRNSSSLRCEAVKWISMRETSSKRAEEMRRAQGDENHILNIKKIRVTRLY